MVQVAMIVAWPTCNLHGLHDQCILSNFVDDGAESKSVPQAGDQPDNDLFLEVRCVDAIVSAAGDFCQQQQQCLG